MPVKVPLVGSFSGFRLLEASWQTSDEHSGRGLWGSGVDKNLGEFY